MDGERREDDAPDPLTNSDLKHELEPGDEDDEHDDLTEQDPRVERHDSCEQMRASELKTVPQRKRKAKAVQQPEAERRDAAIEAPAADVFKCEIDDGQREKRFDQRRKPRPARSEVVCGPDERG